MLHNIKIIISKRYILRFNIRFIN